MKPKILKFSTLIFLLLFLAGSCQKDEIEFADENIVVPISEPGISIYKTRSDYSKYLKVCLDENGNITCSPLFGNDTNIVREKNNGEFVLKRRLFLSEGYILEDIAMHHAFTDITVTEMVKKFTEFGAVYWTNEKYQERIIDTDPFTEFYHLDPAGHPESYTVGEINEMIENGTFKTIFEKIK